MLPRGLSFRARSGKWLQTHYADTLRRITSALYFEDNLTKTILVPQRSRRFGKMELLDELQPHRSRGHPDPKSVVRRNGQLLRSAAMFRAAIWEHFTDISPTASLKFTIHCYMAYQCYSWWMALFGSIDGHRWRYDSTEVCQASAAGVAWYSFQNPLSRTVGHGRGFAGDVGQRTVD